MAAQNVTYTVATGATIYGGMTAPAPLPTFDSLAIGGTSDIPWNQQDGKPMNVELHGSSGAGSNGKMHTATVSGSMAFRGDTTFQFSLVPAWDGSQYWVKLRPIDEYIIAGYPNRESAHIGILGTDGKIHLVSERRYDTMMRWADANLTQYDHVHRFLSGGSMGGWGTITYGIRRYDMFAALFPDRPRWRYAYTIGKVAVATVDGGFVEYPIGSAPLLADEDGGGSFAAYVDMIAYVSNPANKVRPILWCCGRNDYYATWDDQVSAVDALRAAGRAFAFAWNDGNHEVGSIPHELFQSYKRDTFSRNHGWPLFTEHSLDKDPRVDLVGGINVGLSFRSVVETASGWSCEVTSVLSACTVKVKPVSEVFKANVAAQLVTIPAANTWVPVTFAA